MLYLNNICYNIKINDYDIIYINGTIVMENYR